MTFYQELCLDILDSFGNVTKTIAETLLRQGASQISDISKATLLPPHEVRIGLATLYTHNIVSKTKEGYKIFPLHILSRLRFPQFIHLVKKKYKKKSHPVIVEYLLIVGTSSAAKIIEDLTTPNNKYTKEIFTQIEIQQAINELIRDLLIIDPSYSIFTQIQNPDNKRFAEKKTEEIEEKAKSKKRKKKEINEYEPIKIEINTETVRKFHSLDFDAKNYLNTINEENIETNEEITNLDNQNEMKENVEKSKKENKEEDEKNKENEDEKKKSRKSKSKKSKPSKSKKAIP
eukprot:Anaeramoba_ignava/a608378_16.p1 GENE.a608378_16~~a608378_16.p1  ORF type:complete len:289 (+),score=116.72 a608378_16:18-884(+)